MGSFGKNEDCPPSQELLLFLNGELSADDRGSVRAHIAECEFCAAEIDFYMFYPPEPQADIPAEPVPTALYELASAILTAGHADPGTLEALLGDADKL